MDRALYIAMTGAKNNMMAQTSHANNMANATTTGFKADFEQSRAMPVFYGDGHPTRAFALVETPVSDFGAGIMNTTGNPLDVAVQGDGFFTVQAPDGTEAYTRAGDFNIDANGALRNGVGLVVMGNSGPVTVPPASKVEVGIDGTISVIPLGQTSDTMVEVDRMKLVDPPIKNLIKGQDGLFRLRDGQTAPVSAQVFLKNSTLETSNVNMVSEFTNILTLSRQYEMQVKLMKTADDNSAASSRLLQLS